MRRRSYVECKKCGFLIQSPFECRFEYPLHFAATCPRCGHTDVYHRLEVIQEDDEYCERELEKVEERTRPLEEVYTLSQLVVIVDSVFQTLSELLSKISRQLQLRSRAGSNE